MQPATLEWIGDHNGRLRLIDQTRLPVELKLIELDNLAAVWEAIQTLRVRGAPAIGIAAAYGVVIGMQPFHNVDEETWFAELRRTGRYLAESRPTAVNLAWAVERMLAKAESLRRRQPTQQIAAALLHEARTIHDEDRRMCRAIGEHGATLLQDGDGVLTHCNAGGLATSELGTALALFYVAREQGKRLAIYANETRPLLQGARLTAWELAQAGLDVTLICDSTSAQVMREGRIQAVVTGADRIAANGDVANKIGTYLLALAASAHGIPFYIAAPSSTFDLALHTGDEIPIEQRDPGEITHGFGQQTAPDGVQVYNPAFDVTPARLIKAIICERGLIEPVTADRIAEVLSAEPSRP